MMNIDQQDLDTFLIEVQLANQKVKALAENKLSPEEFDKLQLAKAEDKRKRQQYKKRVQKQKNQKKKLGTQGKGITKDFLNFCRHCHRQYQMPTPICLRCNRNTMTLKQRQQQLALMVDEYKDKKKKRESRKMKWDMWQKTKAMLWKKTSNIYDKWQYFVSDSEEEPEHEPILPKNDPNFLALQKDMEDRKAQRMKDTKKAKQLKQKGNKFMKQQNYQQAKNMYTLALQHIKDIKSIYTNRALAYIKLGKFKRAIKDCTDVIQYMQVFQKVQQNKDIVFKAYLRRSLAQKQLKQYKQALQDCKKALSIVPTDKSAQILKKQVEGFLEHSQKVQKLLRQNAKASQAQENKQNVQQNEQKDETNNQGVFDQKAIIKQLAEAQLAEQSNNKQQQLKTSTQEQEAQKTANKMPQKKKQFSNQVQQIKYIVNDLTEQNITRIFNIVRKNPDLINIFIAAKGVKKCLQQLIKAQECKKQGFLVSSCLRGDGVGEKQVWDFGINKIYERINEIMMNDSSLNISKYFILQDIFQVLIPMSLHQKYRNMLSQSLQTFKFIQKIYSQLIKRFKKQPDLFSSVMIYFSNLCSGNSKLRDIYIDQKILKLIVTSLFDKVIMHKTSNRSCLNIKKNTYSLFANLCINQKHRVQIIQIFNQNQQYHEIEKPKWWFLVMELKLYPKSQQNFQEYMLSLLSLFINVSLGTKLQIQDLAECILQRFLSDPSIYSSQVVNRALLALSRLSYRNNKLFKKLIDNFSTNLNKYKKLKDNRNPMQQIIRLLNVFYSPINGQKFQYPLPQNLSSEALSYINSTQNGQTLFCNSCNLFSIILDSGNGYSAKIYQLVRPSMKNLIEVAKDKIGNWRKNASILLAKLSLNAQCKAQLQKYHGMDVLKSIAQFVKSS